jgi:NAD-dependent DNA ligase
MIELIPKICPNCSTPLTILEGKGDGVLKLFCPNEECGGSVLKKLEKAVSILELKNVGPATIQLLYNVGVRNVIDIFDKEIINEETLIESGEFKEGRKLEILLDSIASFKEISMEKAIHSLQIEIPKESGEGVIPIGKSLSLQIANMVSGLTSDFVGLSKQVREEVQSTDSTILSEIKESLQRYEDNGVKVIPLELKKVTVSKKIEKRIALDTKEEYQSILEKLNWEEVDVIDADMLIVDDKNQVSDKVQTAKENGIKIYTFKQLKLLFL